MRLILNMPLWLCSFCLVSAFPALGEDLEKGNPGKATRKTPQKLQSGVKGLLVVKLPNKSLAGTASQMNVTAIRNHKPGMEIGFNQKIGGMMSEATEEVEKFIRVRHDGKLPEGYRIELAFSDKYSPKDGPSAAVACALMVDSLISGSDIDPAFAVTGDMTATGEVRSVGGVPAKIRGARKKGVEIVAIPKANRQAVSDHYITDGIRQLYDIQIFAVETFDEARALSCRERDEKLQASIDDFKMVRKALRNKEGFIRNGKVRSKLKSILKNTPHCVSARILLLHSYKKGPSNLSLVGSLSAIDRSSDRLLKTLKDGSFTNAGGSEDVLYRTLSDLNKLRTQLDKRTIAYCDAFHDVGSWFKANRSKRYMNGQMRRELKASVKNINNERENLLNNSDVREELMLD